MLAVGVELQRRLNVRLSQKILYGLRVRPAIHQKRGERMPQIVEAEAYLPAAQQLRNPNDMVGASDFDSSDGGMIAVPESTLEKWKAGTSSDAALWHHCFFDPTETFTASGTPAMQ
jgi:hypothetical protein